MKKIEDHLKVIREKGELTYREMSKLTGVAISTLCNLEMGRYKEPGIGLLTKIARGLDIDLYELLKDTEFDYKKNKLS